MIELIIISLESYVTTKIKITPYLLTKISNLGGQLLMNNDLIQFLINF